MKNKGALELTIGQISLIVLLMVVLVVVLFLLKKEYHIYKIDCKLEKINDTCNDKIKVESISILGYNITAGDINEGTLEHYFTQLNNNTWSRGQYLVIYK